MKSVLLNSPAGAPRETLQSYQSRGGYSAFLEITRRSRPADVISIVEASGLQGRGGAAFPVARKWSLAAAAESAEKFIVANGGEHEPGSSKDRTLIEQVPHRIIEGMALAGFATGATRGYLYMIEDMAAARASAEDAIADARAAGILGGTAAGGRFTFDVSIALAPPTYVAGEETAALEVIEGRKARPRKKPPFPGQSGLFQKPTTINNVETLACVPYILRYGAGEFRSLGVRGGVGTMLATLDARVRKPGVYEIPAGTTFRELIETFGGGTASGRAIRAILPALSSRFLGAGALDTPMTPDAVRAAGSGLGCAGVSFIEEGESVVSRVVEISQFFMREQCGQCPPCRMETNTLAMVMKNASAGAAPEYRAQVEKIVNFAYKKGNCSLIEMAAAPVMSAIELFREDFDTLLRS